MVGELTVLARLSCLLAVLVPGTQRGLWTWAFEQLPDGSVSRFPSEELVWRNGRPPPGEWPLILSGVSVSRLSPGPL